MVLKCGRGFSTRLKRGRPETFRGLQVIGNREVAYLHTSTGMHAPRSGVATSKFCQPHPCFKGRRVRTWRECPGRVKRHEPLAFYLPSRVAA
jgi:hypothetical protein